jgi:hypothetical protein
MNTTAHLSNMGIRRNFVVGVSCLFDVLTATAAKHVTPRTSRLYRSRVDLVMIPLVSRLNIIDTLK